MKDRINILVGLIPDYGSILIGLASIALTWKEKLLDDVVAREKLKKYLLEEIKGKRNLMDVCNDGSFQDILYEYTDSIAAISINQDKKRKYNQVNILMADFFGSVLWPIIINKYFDMLDIGMQYIPVSFNIKNNVFLTIYGVNEPDLFFKEFKEFLLCNNIIVAQGIKKEDGNMFVKLIIPVPPYSNR